MPEAHSILDFVLLAEVEAARVAETEGVDLVDRAKGAAEEIPAQMIQGEAEVEVSRCRNWAEGRGMMACPGR